MSRFISLGTDCARFIMKLTIYDIRETLESARRLPKESKRGSKHAEEKHLRVCNELQL